MDTASRPSADAARAAAPPSWRGLAAWLGIAAASTALLWAFRGALASAHVALAYLLVVLLASARRGRLVGLVLAVVCFLAFNFFLIPPYYTLALHDPLDLWVLVAFLATSAVAAQLLHRAQNAVRAAEDRARELDRFAALVAESLSAPRALDAVRAIEQVGAQELPVALCRVVIADGTRLEDLGFASPSADGPDGSERALVVAATRVLGIAGRARGADAAIVRLGSSMSGLDADAPPVIALAIPLCVRERVVGALVLRDEHGIRLGPEQARFADTLTYYAALAVERVRLSAESESVEALLEADRMKDAVLASVSHDLRTPLTSIQALASELRGTGDERAVIIEEEAIRLNHMVTDLLDLSRIRTGSLQLELQLIAAEDVVGAALQRIGPAGGADRIDVHLPPDGGLPVGRIDFTHTLRIVVNLLENALRHSPPDQRVELEVGQYGNDLVLRVLDRGPGVAPSDQTRIFEPFAHGGGAPGRPRGRAGLGLAIARSLATAQGGSVRYEPRAGGGSAFELRLPAESVGALLQESG